MILRISFCLALLATETAGADDPQLIPQLKPFAWMIGEWGPKSVKHISSEIAIEKMGQVLVLPSDDGAELNISYGFVTRHVDTSHVMREEHEQIVSIDDNSKKAKVTGKVIYIHNKKIRRTSTYEFQILDPEAWATRIIANNRIRMQLGSPRWYQSQSSPG